MKIQCDVCERCPATVICCADEAALCPKCDLEVHAANKLASKHQRLLLHPNISNLPLCDICQEKPDFIFCLEDRALFCKDCDEPIHSGNSLAANHRRFLATGIKVALSSNSTATAENKTDEPSSRTSPLQMSAKRPKQQPQQQQNSCLASPWGADELLDLPDFGYSVKEQLEYGLGELDWLGDMSLFAHEEVSSAGAADEVPQIPIPPPGIRVPFRTAKPNTPYKKQKIASFQDVAKFFTVPDFG